MQRTLCGLAALTSFATAAWAEEPPASVTPFLDGEEADVMTVTGAFGPAKDMAIVITYDIRGAGSFKGFALVADERAKHGFRKLPIPRLPTGTLDGVMKAALIENLDKDPANELVLELHVQRSGSTYTYGSVDYVVLDWRGSAFVRVRALEKALARKMESRPESRTDPLSEADLRSALGLASKK
jgi:hypothetical protein